MLMSFAKLVFAIFILFAQTLGAQRFAPTVAVKLGVVRNLQGHSFKAMPYYSFFPELQIEHKLFDHMHDSLVFSAAIYGNYWDDGVEKAWEHCRDCITYSKSARTLGMRLGMLMPKFPLLPLGFFAGYARHRTAFEYIDGRGIDGNIGYDYAARLQTFEAGAFVRPKLLRRWYLLGEVSRRFPLKDRRQLFPSAQRTVFKFGLAYTLGK